MLPMSSVIIDYYNMWYLMIILNGCNYKHEVEHNRVLEMHFKTLYEILCYVGEHFMINS